MKILKVMLCVMLVLPLCGCYDYNELNMLSLVSGAGVDEADGKVSVTVCAAETGKEEGGIISFTASGKSFFEAVRELSSVADKKLYWGHTDVLVFGEQAISDIDEVFETMLRAQDVHLDIIPVVARGSTANEVLTAKTESGREVTGALYDMFANKANSKRFTAKSTWQILREREMFGTYVLPTVLPGDGEIILSGGAVIRNGALAGYLTGEQVLLLSLMTDGRAGGYLPTVSFPQGRQVSFEILANDVKRKEKNGCVVIEQRCTLAPAEVRGSVSEEEMRREAERYLSQGFSSIIEYARANALGDIFKTHGKECTATCKVTIASVIGGR